MRLTASAPTRLFSVCIANLWVTVFLASFAPFLAAHRNHPAIHALLAEEFSRFFVRNIVQYERPDLPIHFVGSIAYFFADELRTAAAQCGLTVGRILKAPLDAEA